MSHHQETTPPGRDTSTDAAAPTAPTPRRINVAITPAMLDAIDRVMADEDVTLTEAVGLLVMYGDLVYPLVKAHQSTGAFLVA